MTDMNSDKPMPGIKISIISTNLSTNATNRCVMLAKALSKKFDVEIVGTTFGKTIWPPLLSGLDLRIQSVPGKLLPGYITSIWRLLKLLDGEVIIACKPRFPSFGVALIKRAISGVPVILDIDDDELAMTLPGKKSRLLNKLRHTNGYLFTRWMNRLGGRASGFFCVSEFFRKIYGGVIVPHGQNMAVLDPDKYDPVSIRHDIGIHKDQVIIGFVGTLHPHKGVDLILAAMRRLNNPNLLLMVVGAPLDHPYANELQQQYPGMLLLIPPQPLEKLPMYLAASDMVVLPQRNTPESLGQMPAKLTDAMAMAKPIIASGLSDIPDYLEDCGLVVDPDDVEALADKIAWVASHKELAIVMGRKARERAIEKLSLDAMLQAMESEIQRVLPNRQQNSRS